MKGDSIIITYRGKPAAALGPLTENSFEDFILENSPKIRRMIAEAEKDIQQGKLVLLDDFITKLNE
jgi:antitoxin (DNA-binding transcriptional repressor) of toxin-antitoxin stability system